MKASLVRRIPGPTTICYDCDHELYPNGKIIFDDVLAKQDSKGSWIARTVKKQTEDGPG